MQNVMDAAMSLQVLVYLEQKELVRCRPQRQGIRITSGQSLADVWGPNGNRPSLSAAFAFTALAPVHPRFLSG